MKIKKPIKEIKKEPEINQKSVDLAIAEAKLANVKAERAEAKDMKTIELCNFWIAHWEKIISDLENN